MYTVKIRAPSPRAYWHTDWMMMRVLSALDGWHQDQTVMLEPSPVGIITEIILNGIRDETCDSGIGSSA
jgi:hypothetical protein